MNNFSNDSERLEFALTALRNIHSFGANCVPGNEESAMIEMARLAQATVSIIEHSQHEPAAEMNDLLLEIHEQM